MRILFSANPGFGHLYPLLPLARWFREHGHKVAVAVSSALGATVKDEGFDLLAAGPDFPALLAEAARRHPEISASSPEGALRATIPVFAEIRPEFTLPEALDAAASWRPSLIIAEHADFVGPLVAAKLDIPCATVSYGPGHEPGWLASAAAAVAPFHTGSGLAPPRDGGLYDWLYLDTCPPALQDPRFRRPPATHAMRPQPHERPGPRWRPPDFGARGGKPLILLTLGTLHGDVTVFSAVLDGLRSVDANVLVTVGPDVDPAEVAVDPARVRVERFVPMAEALPWCALVVAHGGAGTTLSALTAGIPLVLLPQASDQFRNSDRAAAAGAAITIPPARFGAAEVAGAAGVVLRDNTFRAAAHRVRDQVAALPSVGSAARFIIRKHREEVSGARKNTK